MNLEKGYPFFFFLDLFTYYTERERVCAEGGSEERERESQIESLLTEEPHVGLDLTTLRS